MNILHRCLQLTVTGSGTATPPASALAAIPGVYQMSDPSIDIDVYSQPGVTVSRLNSKRSSAPGQTAYNRNRPTPFPGLHPGLVRIRCIRPAEIRDFSVMILGFWRWMHTLRWIALRNLVALSQCNKVKEKQT